MTMTLVKAAPDPKRRYVVGPDGAPLTLADLPAPGQCRWVAGRKAQVLAAVRGGLMSLDEARSRYLLTVDEFASWQATFDLHGTAGLRAKLPVRRKA